MLRRGANASPYGVDAMALMGDVIMMLSHGNGHRYHTNNGERIITTTWRDAIAAAAPHHVDGRHGVPERLNT